MIKKYKLSELEGCYFRYLVPEKKCGEAWREAVCYCWCSNIEGRTGIRNMHNKLNIDFGDMKWSSDVEIPAEIITKEQLPEYFL